MLIKKPQYETALNILKNIDSIILKKISEEFKNATLKINHVLNGQTDFENFLKSDLPEIQNLFRKVNLEVAYFLHYVDYDFIEKEGYGDIGAFKANIQLVLGRSAVMERHLINALAYKYKALGLSKSTEAHVVNLREYLRLGVGYSISERENENKIPCIFKTTLKNAMVAISNETDQIKNLAHNNDELSSYIKMALENGRLIKVAEVVENLEFSFAMQNVIQNKDSVFTDFIDVIQSVLKVPAQSVLMVQLDEAEISDPTKFSLGYSIIDFSKADELETRFKSCYSGELQFMYGINQHSLNFYYPDLDKAILNLSEDESNSVVFEDCCNSTVMQNLQSFIHHMSEHFDYVYFINGNVLIKNNKDMQSGLDKAEKIFNESLQNGNFMSVDNSKKPA